jgi:hypothetical protein
VRHGGAIALEFALFGGGIEMDFVVAAEGIVLPLLIRDAVKDVTLIAGRS